LLKVWCLGFCPKGVGIVGKENASPGEGKFIPSKESGVMAEEQAQNNADAKVVAEGEEAKKPSRKKLFIIIGAGVGLLLIILVALWFFMGSGEPEVVGDPAQGTDVVEGEGESTTTEDSSGATPSATNTEGSTGASAEGEKTEELDIDFGETHTFKPFQLNLGNPLENHYVRVEVSIEYRGGENHLKEITRREPQLRDVVVSIVGKKSREFLLSPDGKDQLRRELLIQMNRYMKTPIEAVFITDFLVE
jgi:flagellar basal body-associated protein FliL